MSDQEIVEKINSQLYVAVALQITADCAERLTPYNQSRIERLRSTAQQFTAHSLRLLATHRLAVARWMDARLPEPKWVATIQ